VKGMQVGTYGGYVEFLDAREANKSEQNRIEWTTQLAAISRGKDKSANPTKRYASLMKEAEGGKPSRPFEFLPVVFSKNKNEDSLKIVTEDKQALDIIRYGHFSDIEFNESTSLYTNMRACLNAGIEYEKIPYNEEINDFAAFKIKAPMFVWAQIVTHTQLSTESQSDRVAEELDYWIPDDLVEKLEKLESDNAYIDEITQKVYMDTIELADDIASGNIPTTHEGFVSYMINTASQRDVQALLKALEYPREIWSRAPYYFKMKQFIITGWVNDDNAWPHFLRERNAYMNDGGPKNWTQPETQKYAFGIRRLLEENLGLSKDKVLS
jgi:hypothetical protein